jgi:hypothetical protein
VRGARRIAPALIDRTCNTCSRRRRDQPIDGDTPTEGESAAEFDRKALVEDARALVAALEAIHPDPYVGYDGRVGLHARLERIARDLPGTATVEEFYRRAAPLVASMNDSHSRLQPPTRDDSPDGSEGDRRLPVSLRVVGDRLYVESVFDGALDDLLGARLLAVEGELVGTLADRVAALRGAENEYTALLFAARTIEDHGPLARLLDRPASPTEPMIRVEVDGEKRSVALTPVAAEREPTGELDETFPHPIGTGPRYRLYEGGDVAVFVPGDLSGYRESFEVPMDRDAGRVTDLAPVAYDRYVGGDRPDDLAATVVALPSVTETLIEMSDETAAAGTDILIIDLRDNPGGDSQFVFHLAYVLRGWEGVSKTVEHIRSLKRRTEPHRERYGAGEEETDGPESVGGDPADYDFSGFLDDPDADEDEPVSKVRDLLMRSATFAKLAETGSYEAACNPDRIVVAISASTMNSGFAGAAQLTELGAEIVGVPSGQAPRSFGEAVEETLLNTGLTVSIARVDVSLGVRPGGERPSAGPGTDAGPIRAVRPRCRRCASVGVRLRRERCKRQSGHRPARTGRIAAITGLGSGQSPLDSSLITRRRGRTRATPLWSPRSPSRSR